MLCNEARLDSDVDVLVELASRGKTFDRFMALVDLLEDILEHRDVLARPIFSFFLIYS